MHGFWATKSEGIGLIVRAIKFPRFPTYVIAITDGWMTCNLKTALCTVVHCAVKMSELMKSYIAEILFNSNSFLHPDYCKQHVNQLTVELEDEL